MNNMTEIPKNMRRTGMLLFRDAFVEAHSGIKLICVVYSSGCRNFAKS